MTVASIHPAGLARIILINSYIHSENGPDFFEFDFAGHTQVNGANGSGKTSLLKLIPFFYGLEPGRITSSSGVRRNFSGYYLPYADSAIVFEYYAGNGNLVHVVVTNATRDTSSRGLVYRFVPSPFEARDVVAFDNTEQRYRIRDWSTYKQVLRNRGVKSESLVYSVDAYRSIIQNIATADNARLRSEYSLSSGRRELRFIDGIALSLITGRINFDNIKLLLTDILRRDHSEISLELRESDIARWCDDVAAYRALDEHREKLEKAASAGGSYRIALDNLRHGAARLERLSADCKERLASKNEALIEAEKARNTCKESYEERHTELSAKVAQAETKVEAQEQKVRDLENMQAHFEEENAAVWLHEIESRPAAEAEAARCKSLLQAATSQVQDITHEFELRKSEAERVYLRRKNELEQKASVSREKFSAELAENDKRFREDNDKARAANRERTDSLRTRLAELKTKSERLDFMSSHVEVSRELNSALEAATSQEKNYYADVRNAEKELRNLSSKRTSLLRSRDSLVLKLEKLNNDRTRLKERIEALTRQLEAPDGTLASFLSDNLNTWVENEGRLLPTALLMRQDLNPRLYNSDAQETSANLTDAKSLQLGRIILDVSSLPSPEVPGDDTREVIAKLSEELTALGSRIKSAEEEIATIENENASLSGRILELERQVSTDDRLEELKSRVAMAQNDVAQFKKTKAQEFNAENEVIKRELRAVTAECEKAEEALRTLLGERNDSYLLNKSDIELRASSAEASYTKSLNELKTSYQAEASRLKAVMHDRLSEGHVDEKLLHDLEKAASDAQARVEALEAHSVLASEYRTWISGAGSTLGDERTALSGLRRALSESRDALKDAETEMKYILDRMRRDIETATAEVRADNELAGRLKALANRLSDLDIKAVTVVNGEDLQPSVVISEISSELSAFIAMNRSLKECLDEVASTMARFPQNVICACWEQARDPSHADCDLTGIEDFEQRRIILDTAAARVLIESTLPAQKRSLIDNGRNISHMITEYYHHLREFDARIQAFSGRISEIVRSNLQFGAFDSFNVRLEPCITRLAGWDSMKEIAEYYASWEGSAGLRGELPSAEFTERMMDFARRFVNGQLRNDMSDLFTVVFEVMENGKFKRAASARELEELSSNGLTFLLVCALYISLINETRGGRNIIIHWPVDEMSKLSGKNVHILLDVMDRNNIAMVSAAPDLSTAVAVQFRSIYRIAKDGVYVNAEAINPVGAALARKAQGLTANDKFTALISPDTKDAKTDQETTDKNEVSNTDNTSVTNSTGNAADADAIESKQDSRAKSDQEQEQNQNQQDEQA